jgi:hypothetical protein
MRIEPKRAIYEENDKLGLGIHEALRGRGLFTINILGGPGAGKTSLIETGGDCQSLCSDDPGDPEANDHSRRFVAVHREHRRSYMPSGVSHW